jgi:hypothetical protein
VSILCARHTHPPTHPRLPQEEEEEPEPEKVRVGTIRGGLQDIDSSESEENIRPTEPVNVMW